MPASIRLAFTAAVSAVAVLAVAVTVAQQAPEPLDRWLSDYPLPAIDRGLRDPGCAAPAAHRRRDLPARQPGGEVPRRHVGDGAPRDGSAGGRRHDAGDVERELRRPAARRRRRRRARGRAAQRTTRRGLRPGALSGSTALRPERSALLAPVELPGDRHGAGLGHQHRRLVRDHRGRAGHRRGLQQRSAAPDTIAWQIGDVTVPSLGTCIVRPRTRTWSPARPLRRPAGLHLGRHAAVRRGRPRHARGGHHRTADQQQRRRRRHGVQRADHAGESHRQRLGHGVQQPVRRHRRHGGAGRALRRGQRRQGPQPEHRPQRPAGAGGRGRHPLRGVAAARSSPWPAATISCGGSGRSGWRSSRPEWTGWWRSAP